MKPIFFIGNSLAALRDFPDDARSLAGQQLFDVQMGDEPVDWKPMPVVGPGVRELRIRQPSGAFRVIYLTTTKAGVVVFHAFEKKTQKTLQPDIDLAQRRYRAWKKEQ